MLVKLYKYKPPKNYQMYQNEATYMQHLQRQKDGDLIHQNPPLYIAASSEYRIDGAAFGKDLQRSRYFRYMSGLITEQLETRQKSKAGSVNK